jgi:hypothetical protein
MGAFNAWVKGTYLEQAENRRVADLAEHIMRGAAYLYRVQALQIQGAQFPPQIAGYTPSE